MRIIELFADIGACSSALNRIGLDIEIVEEKKDGNESEIMTGEIKAANCPPILTGGGRMPTELEGSAECTLEIKTVSRKRFIKLLMSHGIARNGAKDIADYVHKKYGEYNPMHLMLL